VLHHVSIEALLGHKIKPLLELPSYDTIASFRAMQCNTIMEILKPDPYATGRWLGSLAWTFGAWVHSYKIATTILDECLGFCEANDAQYLTFYWYDDSGSDDARYLYLGSLDFDALPVIEFWNQGTD
jgi:hypothetical protein